MSIDSLIISPINEVGAPPAPPADLSVQGVTGRGITLSFMDNSADEFGFDIWRGASANVCQVGTPHSTLAAGQTSNTDIAVESGATYFIMSVRPMQAGKVVVQVTSQRRQVFPHLLPRAAQQLRVQQSLL